MPKVLTDAIELQRQSPLQPSPRPPALSTFATRVIRRLLLVARALLRSRSGWFFSTISVVHVFIASASCGLAEEKDKRIQYHSL